MSSARRSLARSVRVNTALRGLLARGFGLSSLAAPPWESSAAALAETLKNLPMVDPMVDWKVLTALRLRETCTPQHFAAPATIMPDGGPACDIRRLAGEDVGAVEACKGREQEAAE
mmetsp:Transcript_8355/g.18990  ORF Transcript_8355/g.18990 Transcript_8355/m.18990 type:complete len:116 (-) Transcript_8355:114-461(-)|eukprot:755378-Hanusia_phi.AAC.2